jgi:hypothetical protein
MGHIAGVENRAIESFAAGKRTQRRIRRLKRLELCVKPPQTMLCALWDRRQDYP